MEGRSHDKQETKPYGGSWKGKGEGCLADVGTHGRRRGKNEAATHERSCQPPSRTIAPLPTPSGEAAKPITAATPEVKANGVAAAVVV